MISKKISLPIAAVALAGGVALGTGRAYATNADNHLTGLVSVIASTFHLDQTQVQAVIDSYWQKQLTARQVKREQKLTDRLNKLVGQQKITSSQKEQILAELNNLKEKYSLSSFKSLSAAERKKELTDLQAEIQNWSKATGIKLGFLMPGWGMKGMRWLHNNVN